MKKIQVHFKSGIALSTLTIFFWLGPTANAQSVPAQNVRPVQDQGNEINRQELASFDQFLDSHREVADQLRKDPSLADNAQFVKEHPELQTYLEQHPGVRDKLSANANAFMQEEDRFHRRADDRGPDANRQELASFKQFLDSHREVAEQLRKDPSLADNAQFVKEHPELQTYLQDHPGVRDKLTANANAFMGEEDRFNRRADNQGPDANRQELARFDQFLDSHREIAEQVRKDPSLVDNQQFVKDHPALQAYLQDHPGVREDLKQDPRAFMQLEARYNDPGNGMDRDTTHRQLASFGGFLGGHSDIAQQLSKDPSLVNNREYMENHPELQAYLNTNPDVRQQLTQNPQEFVQSAQQFNNDNYRVAKTPTPNPKPNQ
ncbi:MAG: hypothetical protein WBE13_23275 [Candidatus Acidiferrum sp.]